MLLKLCVSSTLLLIVVANICFTTVDSATIAARYREDIKHLDQSVEELLQGVNTKESNNQLQTLYQQCRLHYKRSEVFTAYFYPNTAKLINGPLVYEADEELGTTKVIAPEGLQVIESIIYEDTLNPQLQVQLLQTALRLKGTTARLVQMTSKQEMSDWQVMEAFKQETIRLMVFGITGFDTPASDLFLVETRYAIDGIENYSEALQPSLQRVNKRSANRLRKIIFGAKKYLSRPIQVDDFDRMHFIREYLNPLYGILVTASEDLKIQWLNVPVLIRHNALTIFDAASYDPWFYARNNKPIYRSDAAIQLGQLLFFDPVLSGDGNRSCASCHQPKLAFTDGKIKSDAFGSDGAVSRNSPSIINAALQPAYFYDNRAFFLEDQIRQVVNNKTELHGDFKESVEILNQSVEYRSLFHRAFAGTRDTVITTNSIVTAISAYERSLISMNSRFDKHIRAESNALSKTEIHGFNLFMGKAQCGTCHFVPLFSGNVPPLFINAEAEVIGVPKSADSTERSIDTDLGKYHTTGMILHQYAFKTPTIRNVQLTAPYMHNGAYSNLREVIRFYNRGGGAGQGIILPNQTLPPDRLNLSEPEIDALVAFMNCLTDTTGMTTRPKQLPLLAPSYTGNRTVGGVY